jgi:hypothetical protein
MSQQTGLPTSSAMISSAMISHVRITNDRTTIR